MYQSGFVRTAHVLFAAGLAATGCSDDVTVQQASGAASSTSAGTGGAGGIGAGTDASSTSSSGGTGGAPIPTIAFSGAAVRSPQGTAVSGAEICVFDHSELPCTTTDTQGSFSIDVPAESETGITLTHASYGGVLVPIITSTQDQDGWVIGMPPIQSITAYFEAAGASYPDPGKGFLGVFTRDATTNDGFAGVTMTLSPMSGSGPIYAAPGGTPDPMLTATSAAGNARFAGLTPGEVEVVLTPETLSCDLDFGGWQASVPNAARVPVVEGLNTHVGLICF